MEPEPDTESELEPESEPKLRSETEPGPKEPEQRSETKLELEIRPEPGSETEPEVEPEPEPGPGLGSKPGLEELELSRQEVLEPNQPEGLEQKPRSKVTLEEPRAVVLANRREQNHERDCREINDGQPKIRH